MLLSEKYPHMRNELFLLLKFSKKKYLTDIQNGSIFTRSFRHFAEQEKIQGKKGMGDEFEASFVHTNVNLTFQDPETHQVVGEGFAARIVYTDNELADCNVFCLTGINGDMLEIEAEDEEKIEVKVVFTDDQKHRFAEDFGATDVLGIYPREFLSLFEQATERIDSPYVGGFVRYDDFSINSKERIESIQSDDLNVFFWKDHSIEYQNEFRLVFQLKNPQTPYVLEIGTIKDSTFLISYDDLVHNGKLTLTIKK